MLLSSLLTGVSYQGKFEDREVVAIETDSRKVIPGTVFVCVTGVHTDGHDYAAGALDKGAIGVITQKDLGLKNQILVENSRKALAVVCANFHGNPSKELKLIAITGTNGKTSCTYIIKDILEYAGFQTGLIGTIKNQIGNMDLPAKYTTPEPFELNALLKKMLVNGCSHVVMEVSSHALDQLRVYGLQFESVLFTNLTQDHLDYHKTMENYYLAKREAFLMAKNSVINIDDEWGKRLQTEVNDNVVTYSLEDNHADFVAKNIEYTKSGVQFELLSGDTIKRVNFPMPGEFSVYNALGSVAAAVQAGVSLPVAVEGVNRSHGVKGRSEVLYDGDFTIICDYAHTADGLEKILKAIKPYCKGRLMTLFGCAGERDWTKREKMGETVGKYSDFVILTSDNPRKENPLEILQHAIPGIEKTGTPYKAIADRYGAVLWAIENIAKDDILLLAGKGHEDYQVLYSATIFFDEHKIVRELLEKKGLL